MHLFVEKLSLRSFLSITLFLRERNFHSKSVHLQYIYNDRYMAWVQLFFTNLNLGSVKIFDFSFDSLVDENGTNLGKKVIFKDLEEIYQMIGKEIDFKNISHLNHDIFWFKGYVKKKITFLEPFSSTGVKPLINILIMIQAVAIKKTKLNNFMPVVLMLEKKPWINELCEYGEVKGIEITENKFYELNLYIEIIKYIKRNKWVRVLKSYFEFYINRNSIKDNSTNSHNIIAIDQVIQMYKPSVIWKSEFISPRKITFVSKTQPINQNQLNEIKVAGMNYISLNQNISRGLDAPVFIPRLALREKKNLKLKNKKLLTAILMIMSVKKNIGVNCLIKSMQTFT